MNLLAIETSTSRASVALCVNGVVLSAHEAQVSEHARGILTLINQLLLEANFNTRALDGVVLGRGPGSFTGLRIACSVTKGIAWAHALPVYPVSGLAAIAYRAHQLHALESAVTVLSVIDARMQQVYWSAVDAACAVSVEQVSDAAAVTVPGAGPVILAGVGWEPYLDAFSADIQSRIVAREVLHPDASDFIPLIARQGIVPVTAAVVTPAYVRNQVTQGAVSRG